MTNEIVQNPLWFNFSPTPSKWYFLWDLTWYFILWNSDTSCFSRLCFISALISTLTFLLLGIPLPPPPATHNQIWIEMIIWCSHSIMLFISYFWQYPEINKNPRCSLGGSLISVIILGIRFLIVIITKQPQHTIVVNKWKFTQDYTSCKILSNKDRVYN